MARIVAMVDRGPRPARNARSAGLASRWIRLNAMSPPRILRPSRDRPSVSERELADPPAIAATPSAMQARKIPKPRKPPRSSRKAKRRTSGPPGGRRRGAAGMGPCIGASRRRRVGVGLDATRAQAHDAVAAARKRQVVGHEDERPAALALEAE